MPSRTSQPATTGKRNLVVARPLDSKELRPYRTPADRSGGTGPAAPSLHLRVGKYLEADAAGWFGIVGLVVIAIVAMALLILASTLGFTRFVH